MCAERRTGPLPPIAPLTCTPARSRLRFKVGAASMSRYVPARHYVSFGIVAMALAGFPAGWAFPGRLPSALPFCFS